MNARIGVIGRLLGVLLVAAALVVFALAGTRRLGMLPRRAGDSGPPNLHTGTAVADLGPSGGLDEASGSLPLATGPDAARGPAAATGPGAMPTIVGPVPPAATPVPTPTIDPRRIGLIPGHWGYDSGAVCPDGLYEVDVTVDVALRTQAILETRSIAVDLLEEHDPDTPQAPLQGYRAAALVSLHADSCTPVGASGFRASRWPYSSTPAADDRLLACLYDRYGAATMLPRHDSSITIDMWNYYAFREIHAETPAAIIELAFLGDDREFVDEHRYSMALGIADAISCFLDGG